MDITPLLELAVKRQASDIFIAVGRPPSLKINDNIEPVGQKEITISQSEAIVSNILPDYLKDRFFTEREANFAHYVDGVGRFRVSAFFQMDMVSIVFRYIQAEIPRIDELELPGNIKDIAMIQRGLVLCVGATGTGKSTTLAAMVGYRNHNTHGHILTVEDPVEYIHKHDGCIVNQREVGVDTESFEIGLKNSLRQAPDVILIGEIRSREVMQHAITFAETGHLCIATLHANNANQALDRIINFFPEERRTQLLMDLSFNLHAIIGQQLIPRIDGGERMAVCVELLLRTPYMMDLIRNGEVHEVKDLMKRSEEQGMVTFDKSLVRLYLNGTISYEDALRFADSSNEVRLMIKLSAEESDNPLDSDDDQQFQLEKSEEDHEADGFLK
jgi:twitching motility protein PilU